MAKTVEEKSFVRGANWVRIDFKWDRESLKQIGVHVEKTIELVLTKSWLLVSNTAKELAPYQTGTLRRSITLDFSRINQSMVIVWSRVKYARRREFENKKHPDRTYYFARAKEYNREEIWKYFRQYLSQELKD